MSAPRRPPLGLPSPRPSGSEDPYIENQEDWSDDAANENDDAPRRRSRVHSNAPRISRNPFAPGAAAGGPNPRGVAVPYGYERMPMPHRSETEPFPGSRPRTASGFYRQPPQPTTTPFTPSQPYLTPDGAYYPPYGSGYASTPGYTPLDPRPFSSRSYHANTAAEQTSYGYGNSYQPPPSQPYGPAFDDGRTGIRGPRIHYRKTQPQPQTEPEPRPQYDDPGRDLGRDREVDEKYWRERSRQKERDTKKEKKERERREMNKLKYERLKLEVVKLKNLLDLERTRGSGRSDYDPGLRDPAMRGVQEIMQYLQNQREQESQRRITDKNDPVNQVAQLLQDLADVADTRREAQARQDRLQLLGGLSTRSKPRASAGDVSSETRDVLRDIITDILFGQAEDPARLPLPAGSHYTGRSASDDLHEDEYQWQRPRVWPDEGGVSPRPRYNEAAHDPYAGTSSPHYDDRVPRVSRDPYPSPESSRYHPRSTTPSSPRFERRQTAPPTGPTPIRKVPPGPGKRPRGSDFSSDHSLAADRSEYPTYDHPEDFAARSAERYQEGVPRREEQYREDPHPRMEQYRDEPRQREMLRPMTPRTAESSRPNVQRAESHRSFVTRRSSMSGPRPAFSPGPGGLRRQKSKVSFGPEDPTGGRPLDDTSEEESGERRTTRPYRVPGERVPGHRHNLHDGHGTTPPVAPEAPRSDSGQRTPTGPSRAQRAHAEEDWSDDDNRRRDGDRFMSRSRESTMGR